MKIVGICRFALLGRGDWRPYRDKQESEIDAIVAEQAKKLFSDDRLERRLSTFEHITLASLRAQSDQDFLFIVAASDLMPEKYKDRLREICSHVPQVVLRFFPVTTIGDAQAETYKELGLRINETLQFRLDDDDAICVDFIQRKRLVAEKLLPSSFPFCLSFRDVMFSSKGGPNEGVYSWEAPFLGVGVALWHPNRSIFGFGHFAMARRFTSIIIQGGMALVTHSGLNDTQFDEARIKRQRMTVINNETVAESCQKHFPFLTKSAKAIAGLPV